jgi:hypothetical protein
MLCSEQLCRLSDIVFYGYDGMRAYARTSGILLAQFIHELLEQSADVVNKTLPKTASPRPEFKYDRVTIVAHSLGAIVARVALLLLSDELRARADLTMQLVLFAPAQNGTRVIPFSIAGLRGVPFVGALGAVALIVFPVLQDLRAGSKTLKRLAMDTKAAIDEGAEHLVARSIVWGEQDFVVLNDPFCGDPHGKVFAGKDHRTVCKPTPTFVEPLQEVTQVL